MRTEKPKKIDLSLSLSSFFATVGSLQQMILFGELHREPIERELFGPIRSECRMDHDKTGCQTPPECPKLCINNCGFFGSPGTMNMCSKCHKAMLFQQEQEAKLASAVAGSSSSINTVKETVARASVDVQVKSVEPNIASPQSSSVSDPGITVETKLKEGPSRCSTCNKRVGLTGFKCRCGNLFCGSHRYADKHDCTFNYHAAAQEAIAKANPVVKAEKLGKI